MNAFLKVRQLDKCKCRAWGCGKNGSVEVHHIIPKSFKRIDKTWNLICLCSKHHRDITEGRTTNIELLEKIGKKRDYRWGQALDWHLNKEELRKLKK